MRLFKYISEKFKVALAIRLSGDAPLVKEGIVLAKASSKKTLHFTLCEKSYLSP